MSRISQSKLWTAKFEILSSNIPTWLQIQKILLLKLLRFVVKIKALIHRSKVICDRSFPWSSNSQLTSWFSVFIGTYSWQAELREIRDCRKINDILERRSTEIRRLYEECQDSCKFHFQILLFCNKCVAYSAVRFRYSRIQLLCMHVLTDDCFEFSHISYFIHSYVRYFMLLFFFSSPQGFLLFFSSRGARDTWRCHPFSGGCEE